MSADKGTLFIVATPIGNLKDISERAYDVLTHADLILCEDTRHSLHLLSALNIAPPKLVSFHDHNEEERAGFVLEQLLAGKNIALISDAGTPLVADPGFPLVRKCRKLGLTIVPIPGPSAPLTALQACGLAPIPYTFLGFLPRGLADKTKLFKAFAHVPTTLIFFERADRLKESLKNAYDVFGEREVCICRELTKVYEEFISINLSASGDLPELLGEITVVLGPSKDFKRTSEDVLINLVSNYLQSKLKTKEIIALLQDEISGWTKKELYAFIENLKAHSDTI